MNEFDGFFIGTMLIPLILVGMGWIFRKSHVYKGTSSWIKTFVWNGLIGLFLISVIFITGEAYYRFFVDTTDSFGLNKITKRWGDRHYQFNNYNWRDNIDYKLKKDTTRTRITIIGDSFTAGHGLKNVDDRFANILRTKHPEFDIHVLASNGFESNNQWNSLLKSSAIGYETDVVILIYNLNDIAWTLPETKTIYNRIFSFDSGLGYLAKESYLLNMLAFRWFAMMDQNIKNYYHFVKDGYSGNSWAIQSELLAKFVAHCRANRIRLLVVTFPFLHNLENYEFAEAHFQLNEFWGNHQIPHLDLLDLYQQQKDKEMVINSYDAHPNEQAHTYAAQWIEKFLLEHI